MGVLDVEGELIMIVYGIVLNVRQAENADEWSYQRGLEGGWIPQNPTQRLYPGLCSQSTS